MSAATGPPEERERPARYAAWPGATPGQRHRHFRAASMMAVTGLLAITVGPAAVALGARAVSQLQAGRDPASELGVQTRDGPVTFVVREFRCGPDGGSVNGKLCRVRITVRNDGTTEVTVPGVLQRLHGPDGVRLLPVPVDRNQFRTLGPGQADTATITYDLPVPVAAERVELHADPTSPGTTVVLGRPRPLAD